MLFKIIFLTRSQWYSNQNFCGVYSFEKHGKYSKKLLYQEYLAEPVCNTNGLPILQFAGEATHSTHYSTVHGAIETGWREANRIISLYS